MKILTLLSVTLLLSLSTAKAAEIFTPQQPLKISVTDTTDIEEESEGEEFTGGDLAEEELEDGLDSISNRNLLQFLPGNEIGIPAHNLYGTWNTDRVHPYKFDWTKIDTTTLAFKQAKHDYFHPTCGHITSQFGPRRYRYHYGIDLKLETGDPVYSALPGIVRIAKYDRTYGNVVVVRHENGLETLYAHLSKIDTKPGDEVKAGQVLGLGGNTGRSFGSHLHFEVRYKGLALNPNQFIDFETGQLTLDELVISPESFVHYKHAVSGGAHGKSRYYKVRKGDTLSRIASKNRVPLKKLYKLNKLSAKSKIRPGQKIRLS